MALGSNNPFPSVKFVEQAAAPSGGLLPAAGEQRAFISSVDHRAKLENAAGTIIDLAGQLYNGDPVVPPADNVFFMTWEGGSPTSTMKLKVRRNGATITIQEWTIEEDT